MTARLPVKGGILIRVAESRGPSVREVFLAGSNRIAPARRLELAIVPGLAEAWRKKLSAKP